MALNTISDIQTEFLVRNNRTTTDAFITDTTLNNWTREAHVWATGYKKWPFTEGRITTTYTTTEEWPYPENWKPDSIRYLMIGTFRHQKLFFDDYQMFREVQSTGRDRVFSDFAMTYFVNPNTDASGTMTVYGQYQPLLDPTDKTAVTVFSNVAEEGNEAIVEKMSSILKYRENSPLLRGGISEAIIAENRAKQLLEEIWVRYKAEAFGYQSYNRGIWKRFDVLRGRERSDTLTGRENRFD